MKYYLSAAALILIVAIFVTVLPVILSSAESVIVVGQIPQASRAVAGVETYNIAPISKKTEPPVIGARSALVKDLATKTVLYQKDISVKVPIASVTKIMTALIASEYFKPNQVLTVGNSAFISGSKVGLMKGEELTFRSTLYGMLLNSGNDAAFTIAENYPGGPLGFVSAMNKKVTALNLINTHFDNPAGFDSPNHYSTASDVAAITEEALKNYQLSRIFATKDTEVSSVDKKYKHELHNLNKLLSQVSGVLGVKTGYTDGAKENLVTLVERDGHRILVVVLGSDDRFGESTKLIEWTYNNFTWQDFDTVH